MMVYKLKNVCKLWLKKLAVYSLCVLLLNQQLFYLSASIRQISIDFEGHRPGHALFDSSFKITAHLQGNDFALRPESGYVSEDSDYGLDNCPTVSLFETTPLEEIAPVDSKKSYAHEFGGFTEIKTTDQGVNFKLVDELGQNLFLTWHQNLLKVHQAQTQQFRLALNFNGTVVFEGGERFGDIDINTHKTLLNGQTEATTLALNTTILQNNNNGQLIVSNQADIKASTLRQSETSALTAKNLNLEVTHLENAGKVFASNHLYFKKNAGTHINTGLIGSEDSANLDFSVLRKQDELGKIVVAQELTLAPLQGGHSPTIHKAYIEVGKRLIIQSSTLAPLLVLESEIITPDLVTTATGLYTSGFTANIDRLRVELHKQHPFTLGSGLFNLTGTLEFAEPGVSLDSAIAKADFEALYAPVITPFEHEHTFTVDIQGALRAEGLRVFGQHTLVKVGTQPLKYDEPGYDHTIGSTSGLIDLGDDGELDVFAHSFDLQKGHVLAKNGAIRGPNLVHLGRLVRDPGSDVFTANTAMAFIRNVFVEVNKHHCYEHKFAGNYRGPSQWRTETVPLPWIISNQSSLNIKDSLSIIGHLVVNGASRSSELTLRLTKPSVIEAGEIRTKTLTSDQEADLFVRRAVGKLNLKNNTYSYNRNFFTRLVDYIEDQRNDMIVLSQEARLIVGDNLKYNNILKIINYGSIVQVPNNGECLECHDINSINYYCRITCELALRRKLAESGGCQGGQHIACMVSNFLSRPDVLGLSPLNHLARWPTAVSHWPVPIAKNGWPLSSTRHEFYAARFAAFCKQAIGITPTFTKHYPAQTSFGGDVVFDAPEALEGAIAAPNVLVRLGPDQLILGSRNPFYIPPQSPISTLDMSEAFSGFVTLNPLLDQQLSQKIPFVFLGLDAWFKQPEAQQFYQDMACPLIVQSADGTFSRHVGPAPLVKSPRELVEWTQRKVQEKLMRGFIYPHQPIDEDFVKQLHRQAAHYFHHGDLVTERFLSTFFDPTNTSVHPFMFYTPEHVVGHSVPLLKPDLFIPLYLIEEVRSQRGAPVYITGDLMTVPRGLPMHQALALMDGQPAMQRLAIAAAADDPVPAELGAMVSAEEREQSGGLKIGDMHVGGSATFIADHNVDVLGHIQAGSIQIASINGQINLNAEVRRHATWRGFVDHILSQPVLEAMGDITLMTPAGDVTLTAAQLRSKTGTARIAGQNVNIRAALKHFYHSACNSRVQGTTAVRSQVEGRGVVVEAQGTLTTAGLQTRSGDLGTRFHAAQILQHGTYNNQAIEHWETRRRRGIGGLVGGRSTSYNLVRTYTAIPDTNTSTGSVQLTSDTAPLALLGTEFWVPEGQLVELHSVPGAQLRAVYSIQETISRCQSSSLVRSVMRGSHALTRIPRPVIAQGGGRLHYVPLPLPMGETSDRPALTVETFVRPENNQLSSLVVAKSALPGLEEIVAQYPGQVAITPVSLTHHESHYKVVTLSPLLGVSVGIAVACLTHGAGASLLSVTSSTSTFFANSVFSAVVGNLANGVASQAVGDPRGLSRAFNEDAVKGMAVSIIGQYIGGQLAEEFKVAGKASLKNMSDLLGRVAIDTTVQTTLRTAVMQEELNKAFAGALRSSAAQQIGRAGATDIGAARAAGGLGSVPHKLLHGITGALTGALLNPDDPAAGAAAGGFGAAVGEVIGETLAPDLEEQATEINKLVKEKEAAIDHPLSDAESRKIRQEAFTEYNDTLTNNIQFKSRLLTVAASAIADVDPKISDAAAQNAVENNLVQLLVVAGFAAWAIYDTYTVYDEAIKAGKPQEEAALDAMIHLGFEVAIGVVGGKVIAKGAKIAAPSIKAAWQHVMHINPGLKLFMQKMGMNVALAAETVGGKITRLDQAADAFLTRHWTKATGRAATGEAAAAGGGAPLSLVGLSTSEQQVAKVLNQQLTHMPEMAGFMTDTTLNRVVKDIGLKPGQTYQASYLRNQTLGWIAEQRGMKVLERAGYQVVESKLPGNKGFDAVGIRHTAAGDIQDIMIVESKFSADGAVKLARYKGGRGGHYQQMSDEWIRGVLDRMKKSTNQELIDLSKQIRINNTKVSRKLNVLGADGNTTWATDKLPKTEIYKP